MHKDRVKLLLNMVSASITALPRGGEIAVGVQGGPAAATFTIRCKGQGARPPHHLPEFLAGDMKEALHALTIQPYYTCRLARQCAMSLTITKDGADIVLKAAPLN